MKFSVETAVLKEALGRADAIVERRQSVLILGNVLLIAREGELRIIATDMDMEITQTILAEVTEDGEVTIPSNTLHSIAGKAASAAISFETEDDRVYVTAGKSRFTLGTLAATDFPAFRQDTSGQSVTLSSEGLRQLLERTRHAISSEETRYYLNGVMMHSVAIGDKPALRAVATDGHRLARADETATFSGDAAAFAQYIIPRKAINEMKKLVDKPEGNVTLNFSATAMSLTTGNVTLKTKLIDGTFPDYDRVIPKNAKWEVKIPCEDFRDAVERVATVVDGKTRAVKLLFKKGAVRLEGRSPPDTFAEDEVSCTAGGSEGEIGFNSHYLTDIITNLKGDFRLRGTDESSPTIFDNADDPTYLQVLMPMRT